MGSDSHLSARMHAAIQGIGTNADHLDRTQFRADVQALELRLAIIDDRFDRLAARPDDVYRDFRRDTPMRMRSVADRGDALEAAGQLDPHRRRHVAAVLTLVQRRMVQMDARHAMQRDRRRDGPLPMLAAQNSEIARNVAP